MYDFRYCVESKFFYSYVYSCNIGREISEKPNDQTKGQKYKGVDV